jgi:hypothetical protein
MHRHDDIVPRGKLDHVRQPPAGTAGAVQDQHRPTAAAAHQPDVAAADGESGACMIGHIPVVAGCSDAKAAI